MSCRACFLEEKGGGGILRMSSAELVQSVVKIKSITRIFQDQIATLESS